MSFQFKKTPCLNALSFWGKVMFLAIVGGNCFLSIAQAQPSVQVGAFREGLNWRIDNEMGYVSNLLRQRSDELGTSFWTVKPSLEFGVERLGGQYSARYDITRNTYFASSVDNFTAQTLILAGAQELNRVNKVGLSASLNKTYEQRGTGFSEGFAALTIAKPTKLSSSDIRGFYQLGSDDAKLRLIGILGHRVTDRENILIQNDSRDYSENYFEALALYRVGSRTDLVLEYRDRDVSYERTPLDLTGSQIFLDSVERTYLVGAEYAATAKSSAKARVGAYQRDFKWKPAQWNGNPVPATSQPNPSTIAQPGISQSVVPTDSGNGIFWEFIGSWSPKVYSKFDLNTRVSTREALRIGSYIQSREHSLSWTHQWDDRLTSTMSVNWGVDDYQDSNREDDRFGANLRVGYDFNDLLEVGAGYSYQKLDSNSAFAPGYDNSIIYLFGNYLGSGGSN
jgi:polysaccharide biosynthesis protein VpsM